jgi:hypothetical protein
MREDELSEGLQRLRQLEALAGLPVGQRVIMRGASEGEPASRRAASGPAERSVDGSSDEPRRSGKEPRAANDPRTLF